MIIDRLRIGAVILALILTVFVSQPAFAASSKKTFSFAYVVRDNDPRYQPHRRYTGLVLRDRKPAIDGAKTALRESRVIGRSLGLKFDLVEWVVPEAQEATSAVRQLIEDSGARIVLLDLPVEDIIATAQALADEDIVLFNVSKRGDPLRGAYCSPLLFHTIPSHAMLSDAMAQYPTKRNWTDILVLEGITDEDKMLSASFQRSARKFRLDIVDVRVFALTNDPRLRDQSNVALLTAGIDYDAVFLADSDGEFGRYVPFATQEARPVIGTEGLIAGTWHWTWERHGLLSSISVLTGSPSVECWKSTGRLGRPSELSWRRLCEPSRRRLVS